MSFGRMKLGDLGKMGAGGIISVPGPYPAPPGFHWAYVTYNAINVTYGGQPVVYLAQG